MRVDSAWQGSNRMETEIIPIPLSLSNAYLVKSRRSILVDSGSPGEEGKILKTAAQHGVKPEDIALILHTHGHADHAGSSAALRALTGAPPAIHQADAEMLRSGKMRPLTPLRFESRLILAMVNRPFPALEPDLLVEEGFSLESFGVEGKVLFTPGHTQGSISILLATGGLIAGDNLMGGLMGGRIHAQQPNYHYFAEDLKAVRRSLKALLALEPHTFFVGHGGPLAYPRVARWAKEQNIL